MLVKVLILVVFLVYSAGLFYGGAMWNKNYALKAGGSALTGLSNPNSSTFVNMNGNMEGKIVQIIGDKAYVEMKSGGKAIFSIPDQVLVNEINEGKLVAIGMTKDDIRLNEDGSLKISSFKNGYAVTSVTYIRGETPEMEDVPDKSE
jgi:hypothetical protein